MGISDQKRLELYDERIRQLKKAIPDWPLYDGTDPNHPARGIWELDEQRKRLAAKVAKRGRTQDTNSAPRREAHADSGIADGPKNPPDQFTHSVDYRSVALRGDTFSLTSRQAQVIEILHEAHQGGNPEVGKHSILEKLETKNSRLRDTFKSNRRAWDALVKPGQTKGSYRLNL